ncbi:MAG TPA: hypothetical protein VMT58_07510, partial [Candidatus Binataceae bacterium]|nr:hypothetical protein [Candidatus Binataceae bacterium]
PMAALDPNSRDSLRRTLLGLHRELGTTAVHVTHSFSEARELADRIAILIGGRILQTGRSGEVFSKPETGQIAQFLGTAALAPDPSEASGTAPILELRGLTIRNGRNAMPQLAAETAAFEDGAAGTGGLVPARILSAERQGSRVRVRINAGIDLEAALDLEPVSADRLAPGSTVWLRVANG